MTDTAALLLDQCMFEIEKMAMLVAGEPEENVEAAMAALREQLEETVPVETVDLLVRAIRNCASKIELGAVVSVRRH